MTHDETRETYRDLNRKYMNKVRVRFIVLLVGSFLIFRDNPLLSIVMFILGVAIIENLARDMK